MGRTASRAKESRAASRGGRDPHARLSGLGRCQREEIGAGNNLSNRGLCGHGPPSPSSSPSSASRYGRRARADRRRHQPLPPPRRRQLRRRQRRRCYSLPSRIRSRRPVRLPKAWCGFPAASSRWALTPPTTRCAACPASRATRRFIASTSTGSGSIAPKSRTSSTTASFAPPATSRSPSGRRRRRNSPPRRRRISSPAPRSSRRPPIPSRSTTISGGGGTRRARTGVTPKVHRPASRGASNTRSCTSPTTMR